MSKSFQEEKEYLEKTLLKFKEVINNTILKLDNVPRMYGNNPELLANIVCQLEKKLEVLKKTENKPYFARIDFQNAEDKQVEECYIGKVGIFDEENNAITIDWRAPIASMYYDSNIGHAAYEAPQGTIMGELLVKRQYDIEGGKLKNFQDVDTVSNDEILKPYLGVNADSRLKNIVSTIQAEQNEIIREKLFKNLIIQGVAGSGKTTVALHRIAYLVYNNIDNIKPEQYLVIGPNRFFVNYISGVLPDLDVNNVSQLTYDEIVKRLLSEEIELISDEEKILQSVNMDGVNELFFEKIKVSMLFQKAIDKFLIDFDKTIVPDKDFVIKDYEILSRKIISDIYNSIQNDGVISYEIFGKKIERACLLIGKYIEENSEVILSRVRNQYYDKVKNFSKDEIAKERKKIEYIEKELRNKCNQSLKKYFSKGRPKILNLYIQFLKKIDNYINTGEYRMDVCVKKTITYIKSKKVEFEDLGALLYLFYRVYGSSEFGDYRHAVIDEAQDFGEFNFYSLKKLMPKCTFSIFGDLAQSIYQYRGIESWESVINTTFDNDCDLKYLKKSYRTTTEIMESANNVISHIGLVSAEPVIRHGLDVEYINFDNNKINCIVNLINSYIEKGYVSIAIISKSDEEANLVNFELKKYGIDVANITTSDIEYNGGICTITSYLVKGLEFDGVIVTDASNNIYKSNKLIDMKLLYVAMTRPLHELSVLYSGEITLPLQVECKKKKKR